MRVRMTRNPRNTRRKNVLDGPEHDPESEPGPQEMGGRDQFDADAGNDDGDTAPGLPGPDDAVGE